MLHHLGIWVEDLVASTASLGWLLTRLGYRLESQWADGASYAQDKFYIVLESGPDVRKQAHDRLAPGLNHLAFSVATRGEAEMIVREALEHGFTLMFPEKHPYAGGPEHYAAYLEDAAGFEVELVATQ
ncbi:MAG: VOC family protein [Glutamicibacter arilaitensis]|uniref:VOC family protein n=1 Tax=Glutamicibacter arilaitensis TaxID=256701 RepID=UPI003FD6073D